MANATLVPFSRLFAINLICFTETVTAVIQKVAFQDISTVYLFPFSNYIIQEAMTSLSDYHPHEARTAENARPDKNTFQHILILGDYLFTNGLFFNLRIYFSI